MNKTIKAILVGVVTAVIATVIIKKFINKNGQAATSA